MESQARLYIVTGKGGVGKSTYSLALTQALKNKGIKAKTLFFQSSTLDESTKAAVNDEIHLNLLETVTEYVGKKMRSMTIASWVAKAPFFKSLLHVIPGFNFVLYLGKTIDLLDKDPELVLVLDAPASGHALTMLSATHHFKQLFNLGMLKEDTLKMHQFMLNPNNVEITILALPGALATHEALELKESLKSLEYQNVEIVLNNSLQPLFEQTDLPHSLQEKVRLEKAFYKENEHSYSKVIEHFTTNDQQKIQDLISGELQ